jgi:hypothetical protein
VGVIGCFEQYPGADAIDSHCTLVDHDWVYRQLVLYEYGGLRHFLDSVASEPLLEESDRIRDWAAAPMGAYRLVDEQPLVERWLDVANGREVETANIGSSSLLWTDAHAIGRLVPTAQGPMFESAPIFVPPDVASWIAESPEDWTSALMRGCRREASSGERISTATPGFPLLSDVPMLFLIDLVDHVLGLEDDRVSDWTDAEVVAAEVTAVRAAMAEDPRLDDFSLDPWPVVAAMLLDPAVVVQLARQRRAEHSAGFTRLATRVASPAAELCLGLAEACRDVA